MRAGRTRGGYGLLRSPWGRGCSRCGGRSSLRLDPGLREPRVDSPHLSGAFGRLSKRTASTLAANGAGQGSNRERCRSAAMCREPVRDSCRCGARCSPRAAAVARSACRHTPSTCGGGASWHVERGDRPSRRHRRGRFVAAGARRRCMSWSALVPDGVRPPAWRHRWWGCTSSSTTARRSRRDTTKVPVGSSTCSPGSGMRSSVAMTNPATVS